MKEVGKKPKQKVNKPKRKVKKPAVMIAGGLWLLLFCLLLFLVWDFFKNTGVINRYNEGNEAFLKGDYDMAAAYYEAALHENPSHRKQCRIRINEALAITALLTPESVTYEKLDETLAKLTEAGELLLADGCAHEDGQSGHHVKAQILKNEIDEYIEWLQENVKPPETGESSGAHSDGQDREQDTDLGEEEKGEDGTGLGEIKKEMEEIQRRGARERGRNLSEQEAYEGDYEYFDGKSW